VAEGYASCALRQAVEAELPYSLPKMPDYEHSHDIASLNYLLFKLLRRVSTIL